MFYKKEIVQDKEIIKIWSSHEFYNFMSEYELNNHHIYKLMLYNLFNCDIIDLTILNLTELFLHVCNGTKFILPTNKNFVKLIVYDGGTNNHIDFLDNLPSGIKYLKIEHNLVTKKTLYSKLDNLPSSIETLILPKDYQNELNNLPSSIKNLIFNIRFSVSSFYFIEKINTDFSYLSDFIQQLQISDYYDYTKKIIKLPKYLNKLSIFSEQNFLELPLDDYSFFSGINDLIYLKTNIILPNTIFKYLKKLKYLNLYVNSNDLVNLFKYISGENLEFLKITHMYNFHTSMTNNDINHDFKYDNDINNDFEYDNNKLGFINLKYFKLKLIFIPYNTYIIKNLSQKLILLSVHIISDISYQIILMEKLPESLEYLEINIDCYILELGFDFVHNYGPDKIFILPPNLKYLILNYNQNKQNQNKQNQIKSINFNILPEKLIWLQINSYVQEIQKLSELRYIIIYNQSGGVVNFQPNINLTHLSIEFIDTDLDIISDNQIAIQNNSIIKPNELIINSDLELLLVKINVDLSIFEKLNMKYLKELKKSNKKDLFFKKINFNFNSKLKVFGLQFYCNYIDKNNIDKNNIDNNIDNNYNNNYDNNYDNEKKKILLSLLDENIRIILKDIPDSVEVLSLDIYLDLLDKDYKFPMEKFPKSLKKIYMQHICSDLSCYFENKYIFSTVKYHIIEKRFESHKEGTPIDNLFEDYFKKELDNYKKLNEYWDENFDGLDYRLNLD